MEFISLEDAMKLDKYIGKSFVPKNNAAFAKKFFYKVEAVIPYTPAGNYGPDQHRYDFKLQKYHRNKTETVKVADVKGNSEEMVRNARVDGHQLINGNWICTDTTADITCDSEKFKEQYEADNSVD